MTPKDDPKRWLRGTCQQSLGTQSLKRPKIYDELGESTADKGPEVAESDYRKSRGIALPGA
jgi:hypothetical protein